MSIDGDVTHADLACVIHLHSTFSDGTATVPELIEAARMSGADVVVLTDHDTLEARHRGFEGWHSDVLLLVGLEVSPRGGHLLALGIDREIDHQGRDESEIAAAVRNAGGLGFPAHPASRGLAFPARRAARGGRLVARIARPHPWTALGLDAITGIELWSAMTDLGERWRGSRELLHFLIRPDRALVHPPAEVIAGWDALGAHRPLVGIGGLDAHQTGLRIGGRVLSPHPNRRTFALLRTHVLIEGEPQRSLEPDAAAIYDALRRGRCYLGVDHLGSPKGFRFRAHSGERVLEMGSEARAGEGWTLHARVPARAILRLLRDGVEVRRLEGTSLEHAADGPGVWRVEAWRRHRGRERTWMLSNPVYLRAGCRRAGHCAETAISPG